MSADTTTTSRSANPGTSKVKHMRNPRVLGLLVALALLAGACGNSTDGLDSEIAGNGDGGNESGLVSRCPERSTMFELMNRATYEVFGEFLTADSPDPSYIPIGTAWGVDDRLLVTNGHVAEAYESIAASGLGLNRSIAVQAGTGTVVELLRAIVHPDYNGDPLGSPDVALFTTKETLPTVLTLGPDNTDLSIGDELLLVGFPGDVDDFLRPIPGLTVPQATSLSGEITALRSHDPTEVVTMENLDVIQHQAPTSPGTSGSAIVSCDRVVAINNAGTVRLVFTPGPNGGDPAVDRQPAAANNFGVHVRHIRALMDLFDANAIQGFELPVEAEAPAGGTGAGGMTDGGAPAQPVTLSGSVTDPAAAHSFTITINPDGSITGTSEWAGTGEFTLNGRLNEDGSIFFTDDSPERLGFRRGTYEGTVVSESSISGTYYEQGREADVWAFTASLI